MVVDVFRYGWMEVGFGVGLFREGGHVRGQWEWWKDGAGFQKEGEERRYSVERVSKGFMLVGERST